ncbi:MAG: polyphosphate polymerase domain-containing protein [Anaerolineaceae bacterium]
MKNASQITTITSPQPWTLSPATPVFHAATWFTLSEKLRILAARFEPISLKEMVNVSLLNRVDTKFVITNGQLLKALAALQHDYWMLEVNGIRLNKYQTLYFDTPNFALFKDHINDRPERYKVRVREYTDTHLSFLEVKHHTRKDRTIKDRMCTPQPVLAMNSDMDKWLQGVSPLDGAELEPKLWNSFTRITLVSKHCRERVTLDIDLSFSKDHHPLHLDGLAIAEVKMDAAGASSLFLAQMRALRIRARGFSKYALGVGLLYDRVKKNSLKPKLLFVERMLKG